MYEVRKCLLFLLFIVTSVNCNFECDCSSITAFQEFIQKEFFQIKFENSKLNSRLKRLEASNRHSLPGNHQQSLTIPGQQVGQDFSYKKATNTERIDAMESTLARVKSILKINVTKSVDQDQDSGLEQRLDKIEAELASVTNKLEKIADSNKVSNSLVLRLDSTLKNTIREEKNDRLKFEVDLEEKVMTANNEMSRNFTEVIEEVNEVLLKHDKLIKDTHKEAMKINQTVQEYINDMDASFENLQNDMTETKIYFSNIEDSDITDGGWSDWGSFGTCSVTCGVGVQIRSRTCSNPKPSLEGKHCQGSPVQVAVCSKNPCPENRVSFTATRLREASGNAIFPTAYQNYGGGYDTSTGKFTCNIPGIYMFSFQISKKWNHRTDLVSCYLKINNSVVVGALSDPYGSDDDGYSISLSGTFHLNKNDVVNVGSCSGLSAVYTCARSSFTGVLITPDNN